MEDWRRRELDRLAAAGYLPTIQKLAKDHSAPFWWHDATRPIGNHIEHNGTITFVRTDQETLGISCAHVHDGWLRDKAVNPNLVCQIGGITFDPEDRLIDINRRLDLATYKLSDVVVNGSRSIVHSPRTWPPTDIADGELVILGGWPGILREKATGQTHFYFASFITRIDQTSADHLAVHLNLAEAHGLAGLLVPTSPDLGGSSGGPVFRIREEPIVLLELVGVVYQYTAAFELLRGRRASSIRSNGTIP